MKSRHVTDYDQLLSNDTDNGNFVMKYILDKHQEYRKLFHFISVPQSGFQLSTYKDIAPILLKKLYKLFALHIVRVADHRCKFETSFCWRWLRTNLPVISAILILSGQIGNFKNIRGIKKAGSIEDDIYIDFKKCKSIVVPKRKTKKFNRQNTFAGNYLVKYSHHLIRSGKAININDRVYEHTKNYNKTEQQKKSLFYRNNAEHWQHLKFYNGISWRRRDDTKVLALFEFDKDTLVKLNAQKWLGGHEGLIDRMVNMVAYAVECVYSWFIDRTDTENLSTEAPGFEAPLGYHIKKKELCNILKVELDKSQTIVSSNNETVRKKISF